MNKIFKTFAIVSLLVLTTCQAQAGIFSKFRGWGNNFWNNNGYGYGRYHHGHSHCPCYKNGYGNGYHNGHNHSNGFFTNGNITGFTPPITTSPFNNFYNPMYGSNRFPNGNINSYPQHIITDFDRNITTGTGIKILD